MTTESHRSSHQGADPTAEGGERADRKGQSAPGATEIWAKDMCFCFFCFLHHGFLWFLYDFYGSLGSSGG